MSIEIPMNDVESVVYNGTEIKIPYDKIVNNNYAEKAISK